VSGSVDRQAQPRQAAPVGKLNLLRAAGKKWVARLLDDTVRDPVDLRVDSVDPAGTDTAEASFPKVRAEAAVAESPSKGDDTLDDEAIEATVKNLDKVAAAAHIRATAFAIREPISSAGLSDEAIIPAFSAGSSAEGSSGDDSGDEDDGSSGGDEGSSSAGSAPDGSKRERSRRDTDIDVTGSDDKGDPSDVGVRSFTELELFASENERRAAAMICDVVAPSNMDKAVEQHSPSDIASSARVHISKVHAVC